MKTLSIPLARLGVFAFILVGLVETAALAGTTILYVNQNAPANSRRDGTSWTNAYTDLSSAISAAQPTEANRVEIWVARGTYKPALGAGANQNERSANFALKSFMSILGGFAGTEKNPGERVLHANATVLSGDIGYPQANPIQGGTNAQPYYTSVFPVNVEDTNLLDNCYNVVAAIGTLDARLERVIIAGGCANGPKTNGESYLPMELEDMGMPLVTDQTSGADFNAFMSGQPMRNVDRTIAGGGIFVSDTFNRTSVYPTLTLEDCVVMGNYALGYGGGIAVRQADILVLDSHISGNRSGAEGGGFWGQNQFSAFIGCQFRQNTALLSGGGIHEESWPSTKTLMPGLSDSEFRNQTTLSRQEYQNFVVSGLSMFKLSTLSSFVPLEGVDQREASSRESERLRAYIKEKEMFFGRTAMALMAVKGLYSAYQTGQGSLLFGVVKYETAGPVHAYAIVSAAVALVDIGFGIAELAGVSKDNPHVRNWQQFSVPFNKYATPAGLVMTLYTDVLCNFVDCNQSIETSSWDVKYWQRFAFNREEPRLIVNCKFIDNVAGSTGGGVFDLYDSLHIEGCDFNGNQADIGGGGLYQGGWTSSFVLNSAFRNNRSLLGESAIANKSHCIADIVNCTIVDNGSAETNGYAVSSDSGAEVQISNCILWGNTNAAPTNQFGGADVVAPTRASMLQTAQSASPRDTNTINHLKNAGAAYVDYVGLCEISHSCVQSLRRLPTGTDHFEKFALAAGDLDKARSLAEDFNYGEPRGFLRLFSFYNTGEGIRPNLLSNGNIDSDPMLDNLLQPDEFSPVADNGSGLRLDNGFVDSGTGTDFLGESRVQGGGIDMGCIENQLPAIRYVRPVAPLGSNGSGTSWANATTNLQGALDFGGAVFVATGTYKPQGNATASFVLKNGCKVLGGFNPDAGVTNLAQRDFQKYPTIISGDVGIPGDDSDNSRTLLRASNVDGPQVVDEGRRQTIVDGFTFTKARGQANTEAAIVALKSGFTLRNCAFSDNHTAGKGAAIYSSGTSYGPVLTNCVFIDNHSSLDGGALWYGGGRLWAWNCRFENNSCGGSGGAIWLDLEFGYLWDCLLANNRAATTDGSANGGAIYCYAADLRLRNCTLANNEVQAGPGNSRGGGAIYFETYETEKYLAVADSILWQNRVLNSLSILQDQQFKFVAPSSNKRLFVRNSIVEGVIAPGRFDPDPHNLDLDPQFVEAGGGNYRLRPHSPAIDASQSELGSSDPKVDLDGVPRIANSGLDLGAYEFQETPIVISADLQLTRDCTPTGPIIHITLTNGAALSTNGVGFSYQWNLNRNDGLGYQPITSGAAYSGVFTTNLTLLAPSHENNGWRYRLSASNANIAFSSGSAYLFVEPSRLYVNTAAVNPGNGRSWTNAFRTLHEALDSIEAYATYNPDYVCAEVWVAAGTYLPTDDGATNKVLRMRANVGIYGGFAGWETHRDQRNWRANKTILSGNVGDPNSADDNSLTVVRASSAGAPVDSTAILDGFVIRDAAGYYAMDILGGTPAIRNCDFIHNAGYAAAGTANSAASFENCRFVDNVGYFSAFFSSSATNTLVNCLFARNHGTHLGGAIDAVRSQLRLQNCTIADNDADSQAGGIYAQQGSCVLNDCILWNNRDGKANSYSAQLLGEFGTSFAISNSIVQGLPSPFTQGNSGYDPLFENPSMNDYRLHAFSPAINEGGGMGLFSLTDLDGQPRIAGGAVDCGAYEFQGTPASNAARTFQLPQPVAACTGAGPISFTIVGPADPSISYQWQVDRGNGFVAVVNDATYSITVTSNSSILTVLSPSPDLNGNLYRVLIQMSGYTTPAVLLTVLPPSVVHVNVAATGANDGSSWANAFTQLEDALDIATGCNEVWVAQGTYQAGNDQFRFKPNVPVYGGFAGNETTISQRDWMNHPTVLLAKSNYAIVHARGDLETIDGKSVLDGFVLRGAQSSAISILRAAPSIANCRFENLPGTAIDNTFSSPVISNCVFTGCSRGAVNNTRSAPTLLHCLFAGNTNAAAGGAMYNSAASPIITGCRFETNAAPVGSAIANDTGSTPVILSSIFIGNHSTSGGALENNGGTAQVINCLFAANVSDHHGAAVRSFGADLSLLNCTIANNRAARGGGGLNVASGEFTSINSIFWGNRVQDLSFVSGREAEQIEAGATTILNFTNSCIEALSNYAVNGNQPYDPLFVDAAAADFRLAANSPAINSGNSSATTSVLGDLVGQDRIVGGAVDLGAYEFQSTAGVVVQLFAAPQSQTVCTPETATFTASTETNPVLNWQVNSGAGFANVVADATHQLTVSNGNYTLRALNTTTNMSGWRYRVRSAAAGYESPAVTLIVSQPSVIFVKAGAAEAQDGRSWASAFTNLQDAITAANSCSEIWVAQGTYPATLSPLGGHYFPMKTGLEIYGGFAGSETTRAARNPSLHKATLVGSSGAEAVVVSWGNLWPIDASAVLDGFTIQASDSHGILNYQASPTIRNCTIEARSTRGPGAGVGILNNVASSPIISGCVLTNNQSGGIANFNGSSPQISHCLFQDNDSSGIANVSDSSPTVGDCAFIHNQAADGAGILIQNSSPAIRRCRFKNNAASNEGGGIRIISGTPVMEQLVMHGNHASRGAAISHFGGLIQIHNSTIFGNQALTEAGGLYLAGGDGVQVLNSILWGNTADTTRYTVEEAQLSSTAGTLSVSNSCVQGLDTFSGNGNIAVDPLFSDDSLLALAPQSPAINAGSNSFVAAIMTNDAAGNPRIVGGTVDLGAYESTTIASPVVIFSAPTSASICAGRSATYSVAGAADGSSYIWQVDSGSGFVDVILGADYHVAFGTSNSTLIVANAQSGTNYQFRYRIIGTPFFSVPVHLEIGVPQVWFVNSAATNGAGDGLSWSNAFTDLSLAMGSVPDCSELWVAAGAYATTPGEMFELRSAVALYGGFVGNETNRNQRDWNLHHTVLTAAPGTDLMHNDGNDTPIDRSAILDGFVVRNGGNVFAAVQNRTASPTFRNCVFERNTQRAVLNEVGSPAFVSCVFSNNAGGAMLNWNSAVAFDQCVFVANGTIGGTVGAVYNQRSETVFRDSVFGGNAALRGSAIANVLNSTSVVERCRFQYNSANVEGGGVYSRESSVSLRNSLLANNRSGGYGGAVDSLNSQLELVQCTLARNTAASAAAGVYAQSSQTTARNSILWGNRVTAPNATLQQAQLRDDYGSIIATYCTIEGLTALPGPNNAGADPIFTNPAGADFSLTPNSPCIDSASVAEPLAGVTDLAGLLRLHGARLDRGALEFQGTPGVPLLFARVPGSQGVCEGNLVRFEVVSSGPSNGPLGWQRFNGSGFTNLVSGGAYLMTANGPTNSLVVAQAGLELNDAVFRFVIPGAGYTSPDFSVQVNAAAVIYVNRSQAVSGDGASWATAAQTLPEAVALWTPCSEIWMAAGTYVQTNNDGIGLSLGLKPAMRIYGGFAGDETNRNQRNWSANVTRLTTVDSHPLFENFGSMETIDTLAVLDGLTFSDAKGNAIVNYLASPTIRNCTFERNATAIFNSQQASPLIADCAFRINTNILGGAIYNHSSSPTITGCVFQANRSFDRGGALLVIGGSPVVVQSQFLGNRSEKFGGAIWCEGGATLSIKRSAFNSNSATDWGGALGISGSLGDVGDSLFVNNRSDYRGGGLTTLGSQVVIRNCTIAENFASWTGGGIQVGGAGLSIWNSILWGNRQGNMPESIERVQINYSDVPAVTSSIVQGLNGFAGGGNVAFDPLFVNALAGDFRLTQFSPAVNSGNGTVGVGASDLDGNARLVGSAVDRGAYEFQAVLASDTQFYLLDAPGSVTVCVGELAAFSIRASPNPAVSYIWEWNTGNGWSTAPLGNGTHFFATTSNSSTLVVSNVTPAMNGLLYRVSVLSTEFPQTYATLPATLTVTVPGVLYVSQAATGSNSGADWANAFTNIDFALQAATRCSEIWVARGTYYPPASGAVAMKDGVVIYGGFSGLETMRDAREWTNNRTVLSGNSTSGFLANNGLYAPLTRAAVLDGFVITGIGATAGMVNNQASPTIRNCQFGGNRLFAAAITSGSHPLFENCVFVSNNFGAIDIRDNSSATITNCAFTGNVTEGQGGAISVRNSRVVVDRTRFDFNSSAFGGGAIFLGDAGSGTVRECVFNANLAHGEGAAILAEPGALNVAMTNCLAVRGRAFTGGAVSSYAPLSMVNCTVAANIAYSRGSGLFLCGTAGTIRNTILWSNSDTYSAFGNLELAQFEAPGATLSVAHSVVQGLSNYVGSSNVPYDPLFVDAAQDDFRLQTYYSPAANTGNSSYIAGVVSDLDNNPRIFAGTAVDIGAYESLTFASTPVYILQQPQHVVTCAGETASFSVTSAPGTGAGFAWQKRLPGATFEPVTVGGGYSISTTDSSSTLTIQNVSASLNGSELRIRFETSSGTYRSPAAQLTVNAPRVIYVKSNASSDGDGESWSTAYNSLQTALAVAGACRPEIWVAAGTYYPTTATNQLDSFTIANGIRVYGGFAGTESLMSQRNWTSNQVVLSGDIGTIGNANDNSSYVVLFDGSGSPINQFTVLDGVTIERSREAGLLSFYASPTIQNCVVRSNNGSGLNVTGGGPRVEQCTFHSNRGGSGANVTDAANVAFVNCRFAGNTSTFLGGGIALVNSIAGLTNCLVSGNTGSIGAGVGAVGGLAWMINCTVVGNASTGSSGAGLNASSGNWTVHNSIFWGNRGAGLETEAAQLSFSGSFNVSYTAIQGLSNFSGNSNQDADPEFVDPVSAVLAPTLLGDYTLGMCTALLNDADAGPLAGVTSDLAGNPRQANGGPDLGAFERQLPGGDSVYIVSQPVNVIYCSSQPNFFRVTAAFSDLGSLTYQWQMYDTNSATFLPVTNGAVFSSVASSQLDIQSPTPDLSGAQFRVVVTTPAGCSAVSQSAQLLVPSQQIYVRAEALPGGNGLSWATAYTDLRAAMLSTCAPEIWVAEGTYFSSASYALRSGVAIYGGFAGTETNRNQRNWAAHPTKLASSAWYTVDIFPSAGNAIDSSARLDGFIIDGADNAVSIWGLEAPASPSFANCVFKNTRNPAVYLEDCAPSFLDCTFDNNNTLGTSSSAGAVIAANCTVNIDRCVFRGNRAASAGAVAGSLGANLHIANSLFSGNRSDFGGSAISVNDPFVLRNCTITGNRSRQGLGAVFAGTEVTLINSIVWNNQGFSGLDFQAQVDVGEGLTISNSIVQGYSSEDHWWVEGSGISGADPLFLAAVNPSNAPTTEGDPHVASCSPAIDSGLNAQTSGLFDLVGNPRVSGTATDMGAYESLPSSLLQITLQPTNAFSDGSAPVQFSVAVNQTSVSYQWETSISNLFTELTNGAGHMGVTTATLTITNPSAALTTNEYRCRIEDTLGCVVYSQPARIHFVSSPVTLAPTNVVITSGQLNLQLTGAPGTTFTILGTTNISLPMNQWTPLGSALEISPGRFRFSESVNTNRSAKFYGVRSP